jgi:hypothetical protein
MCLFVDEKKTEVIHLQTDETDLSIYVSLQWIVWTYSTYILHSTSHRNRRLWPILRKLDS